MLSNLKIVFMGTPDFAKESLQKLVENKYNVVGVFTNQDKPSGRGMKLKYSEVKEYAISQDIPVYQPVKLRNNHEVIEILNELKPDLIIVVAYGKILPKEILEYPRLGCINVHGSLLPSLRGAAPIQWSIINGDKVTGITTMFMDEGMDTGDMLLKEEVEILDTDNLEMLYNKLKIVGANLLIETIQKLEEGALKRIKQDDTLATYAPMISKEMTKINFNKNANEIFNFVRGLVPFPGTYMESQNGNKYKVHEVKVYTGVEKYDEYENGQVVLAHKNILRIKCMDYAIDILTIQPENSKKMDISAFLAGNKIKIEERLG